MHVLKRILDCQAIFHHHKEFVLAILQAKGPLKWENQRERETSPSAMRGPFTDHDRRCLRVPELTFPMPAVSYQPFLSIYFYFILHIYNSFFRNKKSSFSFSSSCFLCFFFLVLIKIRRKYF